MRPGRSADDRRGVARRLRRYSRHRRTAPMGERNRAFPLAIVDGRSPGQVAARRRCCPGASCYDGDGTRAPAAALLLRDPVVGQRDGVAAGAELRALGVHPDRRARGRARFAASRATCRARSRCSRRRLEQFREAVGTFVHIAANGGYRSPRHALSRNASPHCWGTAVEHLPHRRHVSRRSAKRSSGTRAIARQVLPGAWTRPFGVGSRPDRRPPAHRPRLRRLGAARGAGEESPRLRRPSGRAS